MIHREDIIHAARPLRFIFWGALLVLLDLSYSMTWNGTGFRFDLLNDTAGMALITVAIGRLRGIRVDASYAKRMEFVHWVSILVLLESLLQHFIFERPWLLTFLSSVLGIATIVAVLSFCVSMRDLCRAARLSEAAGLWHRTLMLFVFLYGIPVGLMKVAGLVATVTGRSFHIDLGPGEAVLLGVLFLIPLISFFSATAAMARSAAEMPDGAPEATPLPRATVMHEL